MSDINYLLHESSVGYAIFEVVHQGDTVGNRLKEVQDATQDLAKFGKMVKLVNFAPYRGAAEALENINLVSEGVLSEYLRSNLELNLPKTSKKKKVVLGVSDKNLAGSIKAAFSGVECETGETSEVCADLLRGLRFHAGKLLKGLQEGDVERAQLGLGHAYSRAKVKFSVQKNDNHIIQAIATLDHLDKAVNTFSMRVREWYGWHFPELVRIVSDNHTYAKLALAIGDKQTLSQESLHDIAAIVNDDGDIAQAIIDAARVSMGQEISVTDMENVSSFANRVVKLAEYRRSLFQYLVNKMAIVAPNLASLIGEVVAARLISHAGSLTNLSKYPASTVQILGAEKALFRALKTKGNTPKYGLIYHSSFIGRAGAKNKGQPSTKFGEALRKQVEERLDFYATGAAPTKNEDAMKSAMDAVLGDINIADPTADTEMADVAPRAVGKQEKKAKDKKEKKEKSKDKDAKKDKKDKKRRHSEVNGDQEPSEKKSKKKSKKESADSE
ncbi:putative Nucleolar protein 56 [Glarea lozoyensis 74030]|uniref:Nucleolar protein 56 n=1 Tax=Glarea lozoyensis (strain ATCC 74030 / MF5533) TaxID=1104152 RepID=H0EJC7_GLAL7|nr:putative Nucleolar protein 56 [Glarea lozoyensis 74030]